MRIGIDLDNTLLNYDMAFHVASKYLGLALPKNVQTKSEIRDFARSQLRNELLWQQLQGLAYGRYIKEYAKLFPGVKRFLWRCQCLGHQVMIVSHKTEYGHFDAKRISLREAALDCLRANGLMESLDPLITKVFFEHTQADKIQRIKELEFDIFIDDLPEVIYKLIEFPELTTIFFSPESFSSLDIKISGSNIVTAQDWQKIDDYINGSWKKADIEAVVKKLFHQPIAMIENLKLGGNAGLYKISFLNGKKIKLKIYPFDSKHDRIKSEFEGLTALNKYGLQNVPKPILRDSDFEIGAYTWIDGHPVEKYDQSHIQSCLDFLHSLHNIREAREFSNFLPASAACFSGNDIVSQIESRQIQFDLSREIYVELDSFFEQDFNPCVGQIISWAKKNWPKDIDFESQLPREEQVLSPSDFGFHNVIQQADGSLVFIDFEYFGWDDPVKLISDFIFHPSMSLSQEQKLYWIVGTLKIYGFHIHARLRAALPLYGLIWCLIVLNDYRPIVWQRRLLADESKRARRSQILKQKLEQAKQLLMKIQLNYQQFVPEVLCP
jgi:thiamine kinase-like enzyme